MRFWEIDFIRGLCVLLLIFDHAIQLLVVGGDAGLTSFVERYLYNEVQQFFHSGVRIVFFLVCGISCTFSSSNSKRGLQLFAVACALTFITTLLSTIEELFWVTIYFGVLHMIATGILFYSFVRVYSDNIPYIGKAIPAIIGVLWVLFFYLFIKDKVGKVEYGYFPSVIGYINPNDISYGDKAALFPEMGYILIGTFLGLFYKTKYRCFLSRFDGHWNKPICFFGRHALKIYLLLPIVLVPLYSLIF